MSLDVHTLLTGLSYVLVAILGWIAKTLYQNVRELEKDVRELGFRMAREYVSYDRMKEALAPVMAALDDIKLALHGKVDKP